MAIRLTELQTELLLHLSTTPSTVEEIGGKFNHKNHSAALQALLKQNLIELHRTQNPETNRPHVLYRLTPTGHNWIAEQK